MSLKVLCDIKFIASKSSEDFREPETELTDTAALNNFHLTFFILFNYESKLTYHYLS